MCIRWLIPTLALFGALLPTAGLAQSTAGPRQPDRVLRPCALTEKCVVRSVGDFNGDGIDDLLFEVVNQNSRAIRRFELVLGPYEARGAEAADTPLKPTTTFPLPLSRKISVLPAQDINSDGVDDLIFFAILFEFGDKAHVFNGGPDVRVRVAAGHSDRIVLNASFGATMLAQSWRRSDLDGDARPDLVLAQQPADSAPPSRSDPREAKQPTVTTGTPILMFRGGDGYETEEVLDAEDRPASATWRDPASHLWGVGDFNGDGITDVLLGSDPTDLTESRFPVVFGPFTSGGAAKAL